MNPAVPGSGRPIANRTPGCVRPLGPVRCAVAFSLRHCQREYTFYARLAGKAGVRAPGAYYASLDCANREMTLVLEDLGPAERVSSLSVDQVASVLEQAAALHASWRGDPELHRIPWLSDPSPASTCIEAKCMPMHLCTPPPNGSHA